MGKNDDKARFAGIGRDGALVMEPEPHEPTCSTCPFYVPDDRDAWADKAGKCRRYPPQLVWQGQDYGQSWPWMEAGDWCGEHPGRQLPPPLIVHGELRTLGPNESRLNARLDQEAADLLQ